MTQFKCNNCEKVFSKFCDTVSDSINVRCPHCGSHWVNKYIPQELNGWEPFKRLPYSDPPFEKIRYFFIEPKPSINGGFGW